MQFAPACAAVVAAALAACASPGRPPLPKRAANDIAPPSAEDHEYTRALAAADVIYVAIDRRVNGRASEMIQRLIEAAARRADRLVIAWETIPAEQQPLLDLWQQNRIAAADLAAQLKWNESPEGLECKRVLTQPRRGDVRYLALGPSADASPQLASAYELPPNDFHRFCEQMVGEHLSTGELRRLYRVERVAQQTMADAIVNAVRSDPAAKLLVCLRERHLADAGGVPYFVAQKVSVRQQVFERRPPANKRRELLTQRPPAAGLSRS